jgi:hypothetical protein
MTLSSEYADFASFEDLAPSVDKVVQDVAAEMATKLGMSLNAMIELTADNTEWDLTKPAKGGILDV